MSAQVVPTPQSCGSSCPETGTSAIPGPTGAAGTDGSDGSNGASAYTFAASAAPNPQPTMPAEGATEVVNVTTSTAPFNVNQFVFVAFWGYMKIAAIPNDTSLTLRNPAVAASGLYPGNAAAGTSLPALSRITTTGEQGGSGAAPAGALLSANNLNDVSSVANSRTNLGLGTAAVLTAGVADNNLPQVDDAAGLTNGEAVFATAAGLESKTAAAARTALGLGDMSTQDSNNVNIQGGVMNGTLGVTTPDTVVADTCTVQGQLEVEGKLFFPSTTIQTLAAANTISPNAGFIRVEGNGGPITLTSTPTITQPATDGQLLIIMGISDVNTVTLQDQSSLGGSNLNLAGGANVTLGAGDIIGLLFCSASFATWQELFRSNN